MTRKIFSLVLLITLVLTMNYSLAQESLEEEVLEDDIVSEETEEIRELTLEETIELTLENNIEKRAAEAQIHLQDIQIEISDDGNADLRKLERDMRRAADQLSSQVLDIQDEIDYVESLDFTVQTTSGAIEILDPHYDELKSSEYPYSRQVLSGLENQFGGEEVLRVLPSGPQYLVEGLEQAEDQAGEAFFEINTGKNETIKQANSMAASVLGLQATRRLNMTQAVDIIQTKTRQSAQLLIYSDTDTTEGFKLLAESSFYDLLQAEKMMKVSQKAFDRSKEQYDNAVLTYEQGLLSESDLQLIKMQHNSDKISLKSTENDLEKAIMSFDKTIGNSIDEEIKLIEPEYEEIDLSLDEALEIANEYRTDMFRARQELELAEKNLEYVDERHRDNSIEFEESQAYYNHKRLSYDNTWINAKDTVTKAYLDYQQANLSFEIVKENLDIMSNQLKIAQLTYELGHSVDGSSPLVNLLQAQEQYANVEQSVAAAEFGRNLAYRNFLKEVGYAHFLKDNE